MEHSKKEVGRIKVAKKALRIDDLDNKVSFAVESYKRAVNKYHKGVDSINDWEIVIKALEAQKEEIREFVAMAYHNIGIIYASDNHFHKAVEALKKALSYNPEYAMAHYNLGVIYKKLNDKANSKKHIEEAKRLGYKKA